MPAKPKLPLASWDHKFATLCLSHQRRALLKDFADGVRPGMSKAEALYQLIDHALPEAKVAAPTPEAQSASDLAARSAAALESVAAALAPLEALMGGASVPAAWDAPSPDQTPRPPMEQPGATAALPSPGALAARAWIDGATARLGPSASRLELTMNCVAVEFKQREPRLVFEVSRIGVDGNAHYRGNATLPRLAISVPRRTGEPDIGVAELAGGVLLTASSAGKQWRCALSRAAESQPQALLQFDC